MSEEKPAKSEMEVQSESRRRVCVAAITGAHGVRGLVKVKSFTENPDDVASYGPLFDEEGERRFDMVIEGRSKGLLIAKIAGVSDRDNAESLRGLSLFVDRCALPSLEDETFYHADLIGLAVHDEAGELLGSVRAIHDFGAGTVLEVLSLDGSERFLPFTKKVVPSVDLKAGRLAVVLPSEVEDLEERNAGVAEKVTLPGA
ncbi:MAG: ribosome maturation factor RimM [Kiloniellales bacterium]|nr:ribosome maturation factor RimM [Kiloniellales bacterium]